MNILSFSSDQVTVDKVNPIIKYLESKEFPGTGKRPMELIKSTLGFFSKPTLKVLNNSIF